jgi:hypothetical protein
MFDLLQGLNPEEMTVVTSGAETINCPFGPMLTVGLSNTIKWLFFIYYSSALFMFTWHSVEQIHETIDIYF